MSSGDLDPIAGDPASVGAAARNFSSIAREVQRSAEELRALAGANSQWRGAAADEARMRAATLPPKLDKVTASYETAGGVLSLYAGALAEAQHRFAAAAATASRARADLQAATAAQARAAAADAAAYGAAQAAGTPPPVPTATRYQGDIDDARARLARSEQVAAAARADQQRAASRAAAGLRTASHQGIRNQPWWCHVTQSVTHWVARAWRSGLRTVSKIAGAVSLAAGLAAAVLAIGGLMFPPLEVAAGACESVAFVSNVVAGTSAAAVELSDGHTRLAGVATLAEVMVPGAAKKVVAKLPGGIGRSGTGTFAGIAEHDGVPALRGVPLGFGSPAEFRDFSANVRREFAEAGHGQPAFVMQGSSVTGFRFRSGSPFDVGRRSDYDVAVCDRGLLEKAARAGLPLRAGRTRAAPLDDSAAVQLNHLGLFHARAELSRQAGRDVNFMIYANIEDALARGPSIPFPE